MNPAELCLVLPLIFLSLLALIPFLECLASLLPQRTVEYAQRRPSADILVPAHNEAVILPATLNALTQHMGPEDRLWVIADNCFDETAEIGAECGVRVLERNDLSRCGKGFALQHAVDHMGEQHAEIAVVVDADCDLDRGSLDRIVRLAGKCGQPVQAVYTTTCPGGPPHLLLSHFALLIKNSLRPLGLSKLGLPCLLTGSGMAIPWEVLRKINLATDNTADDTQMTCELALAGYATRFLPEAVVTSTIPASAGAADMQRRRWIHGHLYTSARYVPSLLAFGLTHGNLSTLALAAEVAVPPLSLLIGWLCVLFASSVAAGFLGIGWTAAAISAGAIACLALTISLAWFSLGQASLHLTELLVVPSFAARSFISSIRLVFARQRWTSTPRDTVELHEDGPKHDH